jgi:hypothetical protein
MEDFTSVLITDKFVCKNDDAISSIADFHDPIVIRSRSENNSSRDHLW